uniref:Uncharacterized protein n=1 Tax=Halimeda minima TaxID=170427 RepID=A0A386AYV2_9CHLO|nr:hypothetical protein [Halimeda minima]
MKILSKISWNFVYQKLEKLQKKITENQSAKNKRICRNLQRLLQKTSFIQLLIIKNYILEKKLLCTECRVQCLKYQKYRNFLNFKLKLQLWSFVLSPIINLSQFRGFLRERHAAGPSPAGVAAGDASPRRRASPPLRGEPLEPSAQIAPRSGVQSLRLSGSELGASVGEPYGTRPFIKYVLILFLTPIGKKSCRAGAQLFSAESWLSPEAPPPLRGGPIRGGASAGTSHLEFIKYNGLIIIPFSALPKFKIIEKYVKNQKLQIKFAKLYSILGEVDSKGASASLSLEAPVSHRACPPPNEKCINMNAASRPQSGRQAA